MTFGEKVPRCTYPVRPHHRRCQAAGKYVGLCAMHAGREGNRKGREAEARVVDVLNAALVRWPTWMGDVRLASRAEDALGIDVVVMTDLGHLWLQVKLTRIRDGARRRSLRHGWVDVIVVKDRTDAELVGYCLWVLVAQYMYACLLRVGEEVVCAGS